MYGKAVVRMLCSAAQLLLEEPSSRSLFPKDLEWLIAPVVLDHSCVAYVNEEGRTVVIKTRDGDRTMPSVIGFTRYGRNIGKSAKTNVRQPTSVFAPR